MKSAAFVALVLSTAALAGKSRSETPIWHTVAGPDTLLLDSNWVLVKLEGQVPSETAQNWLTSEVQRVVSATKSYVMEGFTACSLSVAASYSGFLDSLQALPEVSMVEPYYRLRDGQPFIVGETFCVKFAPEVSRRQIDSINSRYGVSVDYEFGGKCNLYTLKNHSRSGHHTLELANEYQRLPGVVQAHPNFGTKLELHNYKLYDFYEEYCYHVKRIIGTFNSTTVWDFAGVDNPIVVAIVDDGLGEHEDLPSARILPGRDMYDHDSDTDPRSTRSHGTNCAGLIAASHSTDSVAQFIRPSGMISVNPSAYILPIKIYPDEEGDPVEEYPADLPGRAIDTAWQMGADVISCSWSYSPYWGHYEDLSLPMNEAIMNATRDGRNELGTVVVFSAGNQGRDTLNYPSSHNRVICVGAIDTAGDRWGYSNYSIDPADGDVDLMACSGWGDNQGVWTLDPMNTLGYNYYTGVQECASAPGDDTVSPCDIFDCPEGEDDINYMCEFGGTSACAPQVAAVASLLLSRDSTLTLTSLKYILYCSAVHDDTMTVPNVQYGYGRVDAYRAVLSIARGDVNNDAEVTVGDALYLANWLFVGPPAPWPDERLGDVNCDGEYTLGDVMRIVDHVAISLAPLPLPCFEFDY